MIINADDFGKTDSINAAIAVCFKQDLIDRTTVMVNMPSFSKAVELAFKEGFNKKVGLHLNLTEGKPLLKETEESILCSNGELTKELLKRKYKLSCPHNIRTILKNEAEAQIKRFLDSGFTLMHFDSHMHVHENRIIYKILKPLFLQYGFESVRIRRNILSNHKIGLLKKTYTSRFNKGIKFNKTQYLCTIQDLENGFDKKDTEIMVHPDYINNILIDRTDFKEMKMIKR